MLSKLSIAAQRGPIVAAVITIILSVLVYISYFIAHKSVYTEFESILQNESEVARIQIKDNISSLKKDVLFLAKVPPIQGIVRATLNNGFDEQESSTVSLWQKRLNTIFSGFIESHPDVTQVRYIGIADKGRELVRVDNFNSFPLIIKKEKLQAKSNRNYFKKTISKSEGEIYISDINLNRENGKIQKPHVPTLRVAIPIYNNAAPFGIIIINVNVTELFSRLRKQIPYKYQFYITNSEGDFLVHPNQEMTFGFDLGKRYRWSEEFQILPNNKYQRPGFTLYKHSGGNQLVRESELIIEAQPKRTLKIAIAVPQPIIQSSILQRLLINLAGLLTGMLVIVGFLYLFWMNVKQQQRVNTEQARLAAIVTSSQDAVIAKTLQGVITDWNKAAQNMFGYLAKEAIGKRVVDLIIPEDRKQEEDTLLDKVSAGEVIPHFVTKRQGQGGQLVDVSIAVSPITDSNHHIIGAATTVRDITQQKIAEDEIRELNTQLEKRVEERTAELRRYAQLQTAILSQAAAVIISTDETGVVKLFNPAAEKMLGYPESEVSNKLNITTFFSPEELKKHAEALTDELKETVKPGVEALIIKSQHNMPNEHEWSLIRCDMSVFPALLTVSALKDEFSIITGFLFMATDLTQLVKSRRKLMSMHDQLQKAAEVAELGIWTWHLNSNLLKWNQMMYDIYQIPKKGNGEHLSYDDWCEYLHPEDKEETLDKFDKVIVGEDNLDFTFRIIRPNRQIRYIKASAIVENNSNGEPIFLLGVNRDITEQLQYELQLQKAKDAADNANKAKSEFVANMSHEIRTPMNAIMGMIQLFARTPLVNKQRDYLQKIEFSAKILLAIINDILDFSKIEAGKLILNQQPCNVDQLLRHVAVIASNNLGNKDINIGFDISPSLSHKMFMLDELRLQQILINLTSNAIKFTTAGEISLVVEETEDHGTHFLFFEVRDTGIGISKKQQQQIFDGFIQAESSTTRKFGGTGLGLTICRRLVELMGGEISVSSQLGEGSTFSFYLSCSLAPTSHQTNEAVYKLRVLVVDDNRYARTVMADLAKSIGWTVETVNSGMEAVAKLHGSAPYDLVLLDWCTPELDGAQTCNLIKTQLASDKCPLVILVTAHHDDIKSQQHQADGYLVKPLTASMLFDKVVELKKPIENLDYAKFVENRLHGLSLLLVEDNETNQQVAQELLELEGATVELADNGKIALDKIKNSQLAFDAILMDIQMPVMDGYTATKEIRESLGLKQLPIIAMTANAMVTDQEAALSAGMNAHIGKPFELEHVVKVLLEYTKPATAQNTPQAEDRDQSTIVTVKEETLNAYSSTASGLLDIKRAITRFGGHKHIYYRALRNFLRDAPKRVSTLPTNIPSHEQQIEEVSSQLHSLKGVASTMGAMVVADTCKQMEQLLLNENSSNNYEQLLLQLNQQMNDTCEVVEQELSKQAAQLTSVEEGSKALSDQDRHQFVEDLEKLIELLNQSNLEALTLFESLQMRFQTSVPDAFQSLDEAINNMDFQTATSYCRNIQETLSEA
ncbi:response regulator [Spartinivicinus ruber]|uniref:response regulator n=1 Tax=Spartinivicinus ruber TaxID=2683272 RepID=UPI0013D522CA|nr:response regulator [Spartinivicinus ruber]